MRKNQKNRTSKSIVEICLWTIRNHDLIVSSLRIYMFAATLTILFLALAGTLHTESACMAIVVGCFCICLLIWIFSEIRKTLLLGIDEPDLKKKTHQAMLAFIESHHIRTDRQVGFWERLFFSGTP